MTQVISITPKFYFVFASKTLLGRLMEFSIEDKEIFLASLCTVEVWIEGRRYVTLIAVSFKNILLKSFFVDSQ
jgi:hypothetical protein